MSLEDAAVLAKLFSHVLEDAQIPALLHAFSEIRRTRCARMISLDVGPYSAQIDSMLIINLNHTRANLSHSS